MNKIITALALIAITSCAAVSFSTKEQQSAKYIVEKCFDEQLVKCGDLLCETSSENVYEIIEQLKINVVACVEEKEK